MKAKAVENYLLSFVFLLFLVAPAIDMVFHFDPFPTPNEKRVRAKLPLWPKNQDALKNVFKDFESFFTDNFGFRNALIALNAIYKFDVFHISPNPDALLGKDGWMFHNSQKSIELHRNLAPFTQKELDEFIDLIEQRAAWAKENKIKYVFVVGPDSTTINSEKLPDWATVVGKESRWDQILNSPRSKSLPLLDLRSALSEAKKRQPVSYKTDTHWNEFGAYIAYKEIVNFFKSSGLKINSPFPESEYNVKPVVGGGMDMASSMGLHFRNLEETIEFRHKNGLAYKVVEQEGLHFTAVNPNGEKKTIVCLCDSMAGNLYPHLATQFETIRVMWGYPFEIEEMKKYKPDMVIQQVIERTLAWGQQPNPPEVVKAVLK